MAFQTCVFKPQLRGAPPRVAHGWGRDEAAAPLQGGQETYLLMLLLKIKVFLWLRDSHPDPNHAPHAAARLVAAA